MREGERVTHKGREKRRVRKRKGESGRGKEVKKSEKKACNGGRGGKEA